MNSRSAIVLVTLYVTLLVSSLGILFAAFDAIHIQKLVVISVACLGIIILHLDQKNAPADRKIVEPPKDYSRVSIGSALSEISVNHNVISLIFLSYLIIQSAIVNGISTTFLFSIQPYVSLLVFCIFFMKLMKIKIEFGGLSKFFWLILFIQVLASLTKIYIWGVNEKFLLGTIAITGGQIGLILPLLVMLLLTHLNRSKGIWLFGLVYAGCFCFGVAAEKRSAVILMPILATYCFFFVSWPRISGIYDKIISVMLFIALVSVSFVVGCKAVPSLNPEESRWGSFSLGYVAGYTIAYTIRKPEASSVLQVEVLDKRAKRFNDYFQSKISNLTLVQKIKKLESDFGLGLIAPKVPTEQVGGNNSKVSRAIGWMLLAEYLFSQQPVKMLFGFGLGAASSSSWINSSPDPWFDLSGFRDSPSLAKIILIEGGIVGFLFLTTTILLLPFQIMRNYAPSLRTDQSIFKNENVAMIVTLMGYWGVLVFDVFYYSTISLYVYPLPLIHAYFITLIKSANTPQKS